MAFARLALDGIYKLISRSDIAPETVIRFKKRAAQITKEMNVLSPENSCRADIYTKYGHGRCHILLMMSSKMRLLYSATAVLIIKLLSQTSELRSRHCLHVSEQTVLFPVLMKPILSRGSEILHMQYQRLNRYRSIVFLVQIRNLMRL